VLLVLSGSAVIRDLPILNFLLLRSGIVTPYKFLVMTFTLRCVDVICESSGRTS